MSFYLKLFLIIVAAAVCQVVLETMVSYRLIQEGKDLVDMPWTASHNGTGKYSAGWESINRRLDVANPITRWLVDECRFREAEVLPTNDRLNQKVMAQLDEAPDDDLPCPGE